MRFVADRRTRTLASVVAVWAAVGAAPAKVLAEPPRIPPVEVVNKRMRALNDHDFDRFVSTYADDVVFGVYPDLELGRGHAHVKFVFSQAFSKRQVSVEVHRVIQADRFVIVESTTSFANGTETGVAIYEVRDGRIRSVRFVRDGRRAKRVKAGRK